MPAMQVLQPNSSAAPFDTTWNYQSLIGKLNFLMQNTQPDISMPVHMCACYVNNPNRSHQDAMKYLCQYLHLTCTHGMILKPTSDNRLNAYVDSDFAGMWSQVNQQYHALAMSSHFVVAQYTGLANYNLRLLSAQLRLSILLCLCAYAISFLCRPFSPN